MGKPLVIVFLIDALGWEIASRFDFCRRLSGPRTPLGTVLGYSSSAIPSLLSGAKPTEHGAWSMWRLAGERTSPFGYLRYLPRLPHALEWRMRNMVRRYTQRRGLIKGYYELYDIPLHLLSRFDVATHGDPYQPGGLSCETVFDRFQANGLSYRLWDYRTPETDNMAALLGQIGGESDLLFLYTAELDALMHSVGIFDPAVQKKLEFYESFVDSALEHADRAGRETRIYILSDHGMTDIDRTFDVWGAVEKSGLKLGRDYLAFYDSTMARLWPENRVRGEISSVLAASGAGRILNETELARYGCLFENREYGDTIFLANPGTLFLPTFMGRSPVAAMHGYDPEDRYSMGCFVTNDNSADPPRSILDFKPYLLSRLDGVKT